MSSDVERAHLSRWRSSRACPTYHPPSPSFLGLTRHIQHSWVSRSSRHEIEVGRKLHNAHCRRRSSDLSVHFSTKLRPKHGTTPAARSGKPLPFLHLLPQRTHRSELLLRLLDRPFATGDVGVGETSLDGLERPEYRFVRLEERFNDGRSRVGVGGGRRGDGSLVRDLRHGCVAV